MSLILDALRKSEHERQREAGPALATVPESRPERRTPKWLPVLIVLLVLNVIVVAAALLHNSGSAPQAVTTTAAPATAVSEPAPATRQPQAPENTVAAPLPLPEKPPRHEVRPLTTELPPATPAPRPAAASASSADASAAPPRSTGAPAASTATATEDARLPRFADLVVRGELNVPHMHLDIHVYSGDPAERFVFINMKRYNEGNATQEGPKVERITRTGVVMDYQGQRFLLTRD